MAGGRQQVSDTDLRDVNAVRRDIAELIIDGVTDHVYDSCLQIAEAAYLRSEKHITRKLSEFDKAHKPGKGKEKKKEKEKSDKGKEKEKSWEDYANGGSDDSDGGGGPYWGDDSSSADGRAEGDGKIAADREALESELRAGQENDFQDCVAAEFGKVPDLNAQKVKELVGFVRSIDGFQYMLDNYAKSSMLIATSIRDVSGPVMAAAPAPVRSGGSSVVSQSSSGGRPPQAAAPVTTTAAAPSIKAPRPKADEFAFKIVSAVAELSAKQPWLWSFVLHSKDPKRHGYKTGFSFGKDAHQAAENIKERIDKVVVRQLKNIVPMGSILQQSAAAAGYVPPTSSKGPDGGPATAITASSAGGASSRASSSHTAKGASSVASSVASTGADLLKLKSQLKKNAREDDAATDISVNSSVSQRGASGTMPRGSGNITADKLAKHNESLAGPIATEKKAGSRAASHVSKSSAASKHRGASKHRDKDQNTASPAGAGSGRKTAKSGRASPNALSSDDD